MKQWKQLEGKPCIIITENGDYVGHAKDNIGAINIIRSHNQSMYPASKPSRKHYVGIEWTKGNCKGQTCQYSEYMSRKQASELASRLNKELGPDVTYRFYVA